MFHLRNLLANLDLRSLITSVLTLLVMGLLFGLAAWGFRLFGPKFLRHIGLGGRQYANRTRRLSCIPCIGFFRAVSRKITSLLERWSLQLCWLYIRLLKYRQSKLSLMTYERHRDDMLGTNKV